MIKDFLVAGIIACVMAVIFQNNDAYDAAHESVSDLLKEKEAV